MGITVMLADDQAMMRKAMRDVLLQETDVAAVVLADDGAMAIELSRNDTLRLLLFALLVETPIICCHYEVAKQECQMSSAASGM